MGKLSEVEECNFSPDKRRKMCVAACLHEHMRRPEFLKSYGTDWGFFSDSPWIHVRWANEESRVMTTPIRGHLMVMWRPTRGANYTGAAGANSTPVILVQGQGTPRCFLLPPTPPPSAPAPAQGSCPRRSWCSPWCRWALASRLQGQSAAHLGPPPSFPAQWRCKQVSCPIRIPINGEEPCICRLPHKH